MKNDPSCADDYEAEFLDIERLDKTPGFLEAWIHQTFRNVHEYRLLASYGIATDSQKRAAFPKRRSISDVLSPIIFQGVKCFELWIAGEVAGLCHITVNGYTDKDYLSLTANLQAIYLKAGYRKKGMLTPFLEVVGHTVFQELMTHIMREANAGRSEFEVTVEAELESLGGQAAVRILGDQIGLNLEQLHESSDLSIKLNVIDDAW